MRIAMFLGTGRKLRPVQSIDFFTTEPEHEIFREALKIAFDLFIESFGG